MIYILRFFQKMPLDNLKYYPRFFSFSPRNKRTPTRLINADMFFSKCQGATSEKIVFCLIRQRNMRKKARAGVLLAFGSIQSSETFGAFFEWIEKVNPLC